MSTMFHVVLFLFLYTLSQALIVKQPSWFSCSHVQIRVGSASTCRESSCLGFNAQGIVGNYCIITRLHKMFQHWREEPCFIPILIWTLPSNLWKKSFIQQAQSHGAAAFVFAANITGSRALSSYSPTIQNTTIGSSVSVFSRYELDKHLFDSDRHRCRREVESPAERDTTNDHS